MILRIFWLTLLAVGLAQAQDCLTATQSIIRCDGVNLVGKSFIIPAGLEVTHIEILNCQMDSLAILNNPSLDKVKFLTLQNITGLTSTSKVHITQVAKSMESFRMGYIDGLTSLDFMNQDIWRELETLTVVGCTNLRRIPAGMFSQIEPSLTRLELESNGLAGTLDLNSASFFQLKEVSLQHNKLTNVKVPERAILVKLDLSYNELTEVNIDKLKEGLLTNLDLSNNELRAVSFGDKNYNDMQVLKLDENKIETISSQLSTNFPNLQELYLGWNKNIQLGDNALSGLSKLTELGLQHSALSKVDNILQTIPDLLTLRLEGNAITTLPELTFQGTTALQELYLNGNQLTDLSAFSGSVQLPQLKSLYLQNNRLEDLGAMTAVPRLQGMVISHNPLRRQTSCKIRNSLGQLNTVCALNIVDKSADCLYRSFLDHLKINNVIYNSKCCESEKPLDTECSASNYLQPTGNCNVDACSDITVVPGQKTTPGTAPTITKETREQRASFEKLNSEEVLVMVIGYLIAFLLIIVLVILILRKNRDYQQWLNDKGNQDVQLSGLHASIEAGLDAVDGRSLSAPSTLKKKMRVKGMDGASIGSLSEDGSLYSQCRVQGPSPGAGASPFAGRKKFKDDVKPKPIQMMKENSYTTSFDQNEEVSPTAMSVYSYASVQPDVTSDRKRHRSGETMPTWTYHHSNRRRRTKSEDFLDIGDVSFQNGDVPLRNGDMTPTIVIQRKASALPTSKSVGECATQRRREKKQQAMLQVRKYYKNPGAPTPPVHRRALPKTPIRSDSDESSPISKRSNASSPISKRSNASNLSAQRSDHSIRSLGRQNNVFLMDEFDTVDEPVQAQGFYLDE